MTYAREMKALKEEYVRLSKKFEQLKQLARINLDLLFLCVDVENVPEVKDELDKIQKLVQAVMNEGEVVIHLELESFCQELCGDADGSTEDGENKFEPEKKSVMNDKVLFLDESLKVYNDASDVKREKLDSSLVMVPHVSGAVDFAKVTEEIEDSMPIEVYTLQSTPGENRSVSNIASDACFQEKYSLFDVAAYDSASDTEKTDLLEGMEDSKSRKRDLPFDETENVTLPNETVKEKRAVSASNIRTKVWHEFGVPLNDKNEPVSMICPVCGKEFNKKVKFRRHLKFHKEMAKEPLMCKVCGKMIRGKRHMSSHLKRHEKKDEKNDDEKDEKKDEEKDEKKNEEKDEKKESLRCTVCGKSCKFKSTLIKHLKSHEEKVKKEPRMCAVCGKVVQNKSALQNHLKTHQEKVKSEPPMCAVCGEILKCKSALLRHLKSHEEEKETHKCTVCGRVYNKGSSLKLHLRSHTHSRRREPMCHICGKTFKGEYKLKVHISIVHLGSERTTCELCGKMFSTKHNLSRHMMTSHTEQKLYKCSTCDKRFYTNSHRKCHERIHTGKYPHHCSTCGKGFLVPSLLRKHQTDCCSLMQNLFSCIVCKRIFNSEDLAKAHQQSHSGTEVHLYTRVKKRHKFCCSLCERKFARSIPFALHMMSCHREELDHCLLCNDNEIFNSGADLQMHLTSVHLKEKPYKCSYCSEEFHTYYRYYWHKRLHTSTNNITAFTCSVCGKSYSSLRGLKIHQYVLHCKNKVPHKCGVCGKVFTQRSNLSKHLLIHTGLRKYICPVCNKKFVCKNTLKTHMWTHSSVKRFQCTQCDQGFNDKRNLISHIHKLHN